MLAAYLGLICMLVNYIFRQTVTVTEGSRQYFKQSKIKLLMENGSEDVR